MTNETQSESLTPCPECGGQRVDVPCAGYMWLAVRMFNRIQLQAIACTDCGYTQLFATNPQKLSKLLK